MRTIVLTLLIPVSGLMAGCSNVDLCVAPCLVDTPKTEDNIITVEGEACTVDPDQVLFPFKVLFVIDISGSNESSDPNDDRARAVRDVIDSHIENVSVSYGVMTFSSTAQMETPVFTRDYEMLVPSVMNKLTQKDGATNYLDALALAREFIEDDIEMMDEGERARTRYDIQWVSDGVPNTCVAPESVVAATEYLMKLRESYGLFDLTLNTVQLTYDSGDDACKPPNWPVSLDPIDFLEPMATTGRGTFLQMSAGELAMELDFTEIYRAFQQQRFFMMNESTTIWEDQLIADSDTDGIADRFEDHVNARSSDHDFDGCTDRVVQELQPNVGLCEETCLNELRSEGSEGLEDLDSDGLPDCAEKVLGYNRSALDTDLDGYPDIIELKAGSNPLDEDAFDSDLDNDGVSDGQEIHLGTNPRWPESDEIREQVQLRYGHFRPTPARVPGQSCFNFRIENVRLVHTLQTVDSQEGDNQICIYIVQKPLDAPNAQPVVTAACRPARYLNWGEQYHKSPGNGILTFSPADFEYARLGG